jgi:hypothetical protein
MVSLRVRDGKPSVPFVAQSGKRWRAWLTSVCIPTPQVSVRVFRSTWPLDRQSKAGNDSSSKEA